MNKHSINHNTANDGDMLLCAVNLKDELVKHLKTTYISDVHDLWDQTKSYYKNKLIEMGGSYASWGDKISVKVNIDENRYSFDVFLNELF
jgi:hypothetical protein